jgi:hypothetical protein
VYVWESEEHLLRFQETDLARTIDDSYRVQGRSTFEIADVRLVVSGETAQATVSI